jgi:hypothetical protein
MILSWGTDIERGGRGLFGNETVTMLGLARILRLILVRGCGTRTPTLQDDTIMLRATAVASAITHGINVPDIPVTVKSSS